MTRISRGLDRPLTLLNHDPTGDYLNLAVLSTGFLLETTDDGMILQICESATATAELLRQMVGCASDGKVYKFRGTDKVEPEGDPLLWKWAVRPTGETFT